MNLCCSFCGGKLSIDTADYGGYYSDRRPESIWCDDCPAVWEPDGTLRTPGEERRPTDDEIHMRSAIDWARKGTCNRLRVGAVLASEGRSVVSGYNGAPPGFSHCEHPPEEISDPNAHCTRANHAESNVIAFAARKGVATEGTVLYATHAPCYTCAGLLILAGIVRVVYRGVAAGYVGGTGIGKLETAGIRVERL